MTWWQLYKLKNSTSRKEERHHIVVCSFSLLVFDEVDETFGCYALILDYCTHFLLIKQPKVSLSSISFIL